MNDKKGFTLVEIIAVISIIAILGVVATVGVTTMLQKQRQKLAYTAEENISESSLSFYSKNATYLKPCTDSTGVYTTITQKNIDDVNKYLRDTKFHDYSGENLYQLYKNYSVNGNSDPANKYELDPYIKVKNRACYKVITVGELIEQGLINDADGMCNKSSLVVVYRKADAKNTAGIMTSVQESGICKSNRKTESGPVVTISPPSNLDLSNSKTITITVTTESTKLKPSFTMQYGWSKDEMIKPTSWSNLAFSDNTEKKGSATINVSTLNETRYLWIKAGTALDNKNNKTSNIKAGPYAFLPTVIVRYDVNSGDTSSCPATKTVVFTKAYGKNINNNEAKLCTPTKTGYDFKGWYRDGTKLITDTTTVDIKLDHTLVAKWEPHVYTITLDKNAAINNPTSSINITFDSNYLNPSTITLPQRSYTVSGFATAASRNSNGATVSSTATLNGIYTFNGWTTTKNGSTVLLNNTANVALLANVSGYTNASSQWIKPANTTAYAKWTSASVTLPTITKAGYTCGWTTSATGTTKTNNSGSSYTPTANTTMYGVCSACTYTVTFNKNNASATGTTSNKSCTYDENCTLTSNGFSLSGYTFNGWNTQANKLGTNYANGATVKNLTATCNGTVTLYAKWAPHVYTILLDKNGATNNPTPSVGVKYFSNTLNPSTITLPQKTNTVSGFKTAAARKSNGATVSSTATLTSNCTFNGWTTTKNGSTILLNNSATPVLQANVSGYTNGSNQWIKQDGTRVYAKWTCTAITLPTITKTGYECGWTTSSTGTTIEIASGASYMPNASTTLYGVCKANTYTIVYAANRSDITGTTANTTCTFDQDCTIRTSGYKLIGGKKYIKYWTASTVDTSPSYKPGAKVKNLTKVKNGTVTLYGQWKSYGLRIRYNGNGNDVTWCGTNLDNFYMDEKKFAWHRLGDDPASKTFSQYFHHAPYDHVIGESTGFGVYNYNAESVICFAKKGYHAKLNGEWNTKRDGTGRTMPQNLQDTGGNVAKVLGCDLSIQNCDIDVFVNWEPNIFTVAYNANGGTGAPASHKCKYNDTCKLTTSKPKLNHAKFNGWKKGNKGDTLSPGTSIKNATSDNGATITYYAQYK